MSLAPKYNLDLAFLDQHGAQPPSGRHWASRDNIVLVGHRFQK